MSWGWFLIVGGAGLCFSFSLFLFSAPALVSMGMQTSAGSSEMVLLLSVMTIVAHAIIFSFLYMSGELYFSSFLLCTALLVLSMFLLIVSDSFLFLLLGWDGLGASSFFLVVWYQSWNSMDSGMVTFLSNRLGDLFLLLSVIFYGLLGCWFVQSTSVNFVFSFFFACACLTKSAQVPFSVWLPMAMSAPTPISALVHSSTLVTAGVFLAMKLACLLSSGLLYLLGLCTMVVAGSMSLLEADLKKIVALSTLSQLGFLAAAVGSGAYALSFFHMMSHALTKSALFIVVGVTLHKSLGTQDQRLCAWNSGDYSFLALVICSLSLCGVGLTSGAVSKEMLLFSLIGSEEKMMLFSGLVLGVTFTFLYCFRLLFSCFLSLKSFSSAPWTSKETSSSAALVFLSGGWGWSFSENFVKSGGDPALSESGVLFILLSIAFFLLFLFSLLPVKLIMSFWGAEQGVKTLNVGLKNTASLDRSYIDQFNWSVFWWGDWLIWSGLKGKETLFFLTIFLFASLFLVWWEKSVLARSGFVLKELLFMTIIILLSICFFLFTGSAYMHCIISFLGACVSASVLLSSSVWKSYFVIFIYVGGMLIMLFYLASMSSWFLLSKHLGWSIIAMSILMSETSCSVSGVTCLSLFLASGLEFLWSLLFLCLICVLASQLLWNSCSLRSFN